MDNMTREDFLEQEGVRDKIKQISENHGFSEDQLLTLIENESNFSTSIVNPTEGSTATGLIQFTKKTSTDMGVDHSTVAGMEVLDQLDMVDKYFTHAGHKKGDHPYQTVALPVSKLFDEDEAITADLLMEKSSFYRNKGKNYTEKRIASWVDDNPNWLNEDGFLTPNAIIDYGSIRNSKKKQYQQELVDNGYNIGTSGPNGDGVDGIWGRQSKKEWKKLSKSRKDKLSFKIPDPIPSAQDQTQNNNQVIVPEIGKTVEEESPVKINPVDPQKIPVKELEENIQKPIDPFVVKTPDEEIKNKEIKVNKKEQTNWDWSKPEDTEIKKVKKDKKEQVKVEGIVYPKDLFVAEPDATSAAPVITGEEEVGDSDGKNPISTVDIIMKGIDGVLDLNNQIGDGISDGVSSIIGNIKNKKYQLKFGSGEGITGSPFFAPKYIADSRIKGLNLINKEIKKLQKKESILNQGGFGENSNMEIDPDVSVNIEDQKVIEPEFPTSLGKLPSSKNHLQSLDRIDDFESRILLFEGRKVGADFNSPEDWKKFNNKTEKDWQDFVKEKMEKSPEKHMGTDYETIRNNKKILDIAKEQDGEVYQVPDKNLQNIFDAHVLDILTQKEKFRIADGKYGSSKRILSDERKLEIINEANSRTYTDAYNMNSADRIELSNSEREHKKQVDIHVANVDAFKIEEQLFTDDAIRIKYHNNPNIFPNGDYLGQEELVSLFESLEQRQPALLTRQKDLNTTNEALNIQSENINNLIKSLNNKQLQLFEQLSYDMAEESFNFQFKSTKRQEDWNNKFIKKYPNAGPFIDFGLTIGEGLGKFAVLTKIPFQLTTYAGALIADELLEATGLKAENQYGNADIMRDMYEAFLNKDIVPKSDVGAEGGIFGRLYANDAWNLNGRTMSKSLAETLPYSLALMTGKAKKLSMKAGRRAVKTGGNVKNAKGKKSLSGTNILSTLHNKFVVSAKGRQALAMVKTNQRMQLMENISDGEAKGLNHWQSLVYGQAMTTVTGVVQAIMPDINFTKGAVGGIVKAFSSKLSTAATISGGVAAVKQFSINILKEIGEEEAELALKDLVKFGMLNSHSSEFLNGDIQRNTIAATVLVSGALGSIGSVSTYKATKAAVINGVIKDGMDNIGAINEEINAYKDKIKEMSGKIDNPKNKKFVQKLKENIFALQEAAKFQQDIILAANVSPKNVTWQQIDLVMEKMKLVKAKQDKDPSFGSVSQINKRIKNINEQIKNSSVRENMQNIYDKLKKNNVKMAKDLGVKFVFGSTDAMVDQMLAEENSIRRQFNKLNNLTEKDEGYMPIINDKAYDTTKSGKKVYKPGFTLMSRDINGETLIFINEKAAKESGNFAVTQHELLHAVLKQSMANNKTAMDGLSRLLRRELKRNKLFKGYIEQKYNLYDFKDYQNEELFTILSEAITQGYIKFDVGMMGTINDMITDIASKYGWKTSSKPRQMFDFVRQFNRESERGRVSKGMKQVAKEGFDFGREDNVGDESSSKSSMFPGVDEDLDTNDEFEIAVQKEYEVAVTKAKKQISIIEDLVERGVIIRHEGTMKIEAEEDGVGSAVAMLYHPTLRNSYGLPSTVGSRRVLKELSKYKLLPDFDIYKEDIIEDIVLNSGQEREVDDFSGKVTQRKNKARSVYGLTKDYAKDNELGEDGARVPLSGYIGKYLNVRLIESVKKYIPDSFSESEPDPDKQGDKNTPSTTQSKSKEKVDVKKRKKIKNEIGLQKFKESSDMVALRNADKKSVNNIVKAVKTILSPEEGTLNIKTFNTLKSKNFKSLVDMAPELTLKMFGVNQVKLANVNNKDIENAQKFIRRNAKILYDLLPEGYTVGGKSTGVQTALMTDQATGLNVLYEKVELEKLDKKGKIVEKAKRPVNLEVQRKIKNLSDDQFMEFFGVISKGKNIGSSRTVHNSRIKALIQQTGKMITNQSIREHLYENESLDKNLKRAYEDGKSDMVDSKFFRQNPQALIASMKALAEMDIKVRNSYRISSVEGYEEIFYEIFTKPFQALYPKNYKSKLNQLFKDLTSKFGAITRVLNYNKNFTQSNNPGKVDLVNIMLENIELEKTETEIAKVLGIEKVEINGELVKINGAIIGSDVDIVNKGRADIVQQAVSLKAKVDIGEMSEQEAVKTVYLIAGMYSKGSKIFKGDLVIDKPGGEVKVYEGKKTSSDRNSRQLAESIGDYMALINEGYPGLIPLKNPNKKVEIDGELVNEIDESRLVIDKAALVKKYSTEETPFDPKLIAESSDAVIKEFESGGIKLKERHEQSDLAAVVVVNQVKHWVGRVSDKNDEFNLVDFYVQLVGMGSGMETPSRKMAKLWGWSKNEALAIEEKNRGSDLEYDHAKPHKEIVLGVLNIIVVNKDGDISLKIPSNFDNKMKTILDDYIVNIVTKDHDTAVKDIGLQSKNAVKYIPGSKITSKNGVLKTRMFHNELIGKKEVNPIESIKNPSNVVGQSFKIVADNLSNFEQSKIINTINSIQANEKSQVKDSKGISIWDFDDTLARSNSNVLWVAPDGTKGKLTAEEFAKDGADLLEQGYVYDFSEFSKVVDGRTGPFFEKALARAKKFGVKDQFILTARPVESQRAIYEFLKGVGLNIPLKNITGLANSTSEAKALWIAEKAEQGYDNIYFADDALQNVQAVKDVLNQLDVKSKVELAKNSSALSQEINDIIERLKGIESNKRFESIKAKKRGRNKGSFRVFIPPSHEDFLGLLYNFMGTGEQGNKDRAWWDKNLIKPLNRAFRLLNAAKQSVANEYKALLKRMPEVSKKLNKKTPDGDFTYRDAIRVYLWSKHGYEIPGLSSSDKAKLVDLVENNASLKAFAETLNVVSKLKEYVKPTDNWEAADIRNDLDDATGRIGRKIYFAKFIENSDIIFSKENLNKIEAAYGSGVREALEDMLYRITTGKNRPTGNNKIVNNFVNFVNGAVASVMFFNIRSSLLQQMSLVNFLNFADNNIYAAGKAFANQKQYWADWSMIFNSDMMKQRRGGVMMDVNGAELAQYVSSSTQPIRAAIRKLLKLGFLPTQISDNVAIATGGATFYRNRVNTYLKQGMSRSDAEKMAFDDFQEIAEATQQSARADMTSSQQNSPIGKWILAFQNVTSQFNRLGKKAFSDLYNRRMTPPYKNQFQSDLSNFSRISYYLAVQNMIFYGLQSALFALMFSDIPEDEKMMDTKMERLLNGSLDSVLRGSGYIGAIASTVKNMAIKFKEQRDKPYNKDESAVLVEFLNISPPLGIKARSIVNIEKTFNYNMSIIETTPLSDLENPLWSATTNMVETATNIPLHRMYNKTVNVNNSLNPQFEAWQRLHMFSGYNKYSLGIEDMKKRISKRKRRKSSAAQSQANRFMKNKNK